MAAIDTLNGVTQVSAGYYEVTQVVDISSGIDDISDSTFYMHTGGLLRWTSGCTTTFTRCVFHESDTAQALGSDNFNSSAADDFVNNNGKARFHETGGTSDHGFCAPIFRGCTWQIETDIRSDFDVGLYPASAAPTFERDDYGQPCVVYVNNSNFNHFASSWQTINGLVVNHTQSPTGAFEFAQISSDVNQIKDLTVVDNHSGNTGRHVVILMQNIESGGSRTLQQLSARNIACFGGSVDRVIRLVDPIGLIPSATDSATSYNSTCNYYRTFSTNYYSASDQSAVSTRTVFVNDSDEIIFDDEGVSYSYELQQYTRAGGTIPLVETGPYTLFECAWGYNSVSTPVSIIDTTDPNLYRTNVTALFADVSISEANKATVAGYTTLANADQVYDKCRYLEQSRVDFPEKIGTGFVQAIGSTLNFGAHNVIIDPTLPTSIVHIPSDKPSNPNPGELTLSGIAFNDDTNKDTGFSLTVEAASVFNDISVDYASKNWVIASTVWKDDGTKVVLHIMATNGDETNSFVCFNLSTAWDMSTAVEHSRHTQTMNGQPCDFWISQDGTQIIVTKRWNRWYTGTLSTAWDMSTIGSLTSVYSNPEFDRASNVLFNADGSKMWSNKDGGNWSTKFEVLEWTLSTPYDITTRSAPTTIINESGTVPYGFIDNSYQRLMKWWLDGRFLTFCNAGGSTIYIREMTTPYDFAGEVSGIADFQYAVSIPVAHNSKSIGSALAITPSGSKLLMHDHSDDSNVFKFRFRYIAANYVIGGDSNTVYLNSSSLTSTDFDTLQTTGTVTLQNGASTDMQIVDANGILVPVKVTALTIDGSPVEGATVLLKDGQDNTVLLATTDVNGIATTSVTITQDVPVTGRVRKGSTSPFYKTSILSGTITSTGLDLTAYLISDE